MKWDFGTWFENEIDDRRLTAYAEQHHKILIIIILLFV